MDVVTSHNPNFDISTILEQKCIEESRGWDLEEASPPSPLTSVPSSPASSPPATPCLLPLPSLFPTTFCPSTGPLDAVSLHSELSGNCALMNPTPSCLPTDFVPTKRDKLKAKRKAAHTNARKKRRAEKASTSFGVYTVRQRVLERYVEDTPTISSPFVTEKAEVDSKGFVALDNYHRSKRIYRLDELTGEGSKMGFELIKWNGVTPTAITDSRDRLIGILAGIPPDNDWESMHQAAAKALEERRHRCVLPKDKKKRNNHRGPFVALRCGVSHGGGQTKPKNLSNFPENQAILDELNAMRPFKRIAGFASSVMACRVPLLYAYYADTLGQLYERDEHLCKIFPSTIFPAASYNFGHQTVCYPHLNPGNLAGGMCAVTSAGYYDYTKGGHLVLWDCHLVIQFPPSSTILLPSAIVAHSNTAIQRHETRYSFALYAAGALFRWVENGFQRSVDYYESLSKEEQEEAEEKNSSRFKFILSLLPVIEKKNEQQ